MIRSASVWGTATLATVVLTSALAFGSSSVPKGLTSPTTACIKQAVADKKLCKLSSAASLCADDFKTAVQDCFAAGKGASCAVGCYTKKDACELKVTAAYTKCKKLCTTGDTTCKDLCKQDSVDAKSQCKGSLSTCLAKCPQLK